MSSVCRAGGTMNVSTPQLRASWLRVLGSGVNASSGIGDRYRASRRTVSPVMVKATRALAPTTAPTSAAARAIAPPVVVGTRVSEGAARRLLLLGGDDDPGHGGHRLDRVLTDARLRGQHQRIGAVQHGVGHVGGLGPGGPGR